MARLSEAQRLAANAASRKWRAKNRPHIRAKGKVWRDANRERRRITARQWQIKNATRIAEQQRLRREADPQAAREYARKAKGLPAPTRSEPAECECCNIDVVLLPRGLCLDHDHMTGKFRGFICTRCNVAIGALGDSITGVKRALKYLETYSV